MFETTIIRQITKFVLNDTRNDDIDDFIFRKVIILNIVAYILFRLGRRIA